MKKLCIIISLFLFLITGCSKDDKEYPTEGKETPSPTIAEMHLTSAPEIQTLVDSENTAMIDYSNFNQGYISAKRLSDTSSTIKLAIAKDEDTYYYDLTEATYQSFPLQMGSGTYQFRILKQLDGDQYAVMHSIDVAVTLEDERLPFLYPSQYVNYTPESKAIKKAFDLVKDDKTELSRIYHIYNYVITHVKYDDKKAKDVEGKFVLPIVDQTFETNQGICFDYTALIAAMLRSQQIPTRLITGYTSKEYHSWVEVWVDDKGWINPQVYFKTKIWNRIDPTFAAQGEEYDGEYQKRYVY